MKRPSSADPTSSPLAARAFCAANRCRGILCVRALCIANRCVRAFGALVLVGVLAVAAPASAGVHKCARGDGSVTYQEDPCPAGKELRDFDRDPPTVSVVPFRIAPGSDTRAVAPAPSVPRAMGERKSRKGAGRGVHAAERKFLVPGIGDGEVVARIGRPDMSSGAGRKTMRWTYLPAPDDPQTVTTLTFELGRLIEVERKIVPQ